MNGKKKCTTYLVHNHLDTLQTQNATYTAILQNAAFMLNNIDVTKQWLQYRSLEYMKKHSIKILYT